MTQLEQLEHVWLSCERFIPDPLDRRQCLMFLVSLYTDSIEELKKSEIFEIEFTAKQQKLVDVSEIDAAFNIFRQEYLEAQAKNATIIDETRKKLDHGT